MALPEEEGCLTTFFRIFMGSVLLVLLLVRPALNRIKRSEGD